MSPTHPDVVPAQPGAYPPRTGNAVRPLVDGVPAFRRIAEAVDAARRSVWVTVAFVDRTAELPDGHGTLFDVLDRAARRGLDVRAVFWREPDLDPGRPGWEHFPGTEGQRSWLATRGSSFLARWDHLPRCCHHQKSWIVDAGEPGEVAFVGGINLDRMSIVEPGHRAPGEHYHDVHLELAGPAASDVHHNFVQRWNAASERAKPDGAWPDPTRADDLPFPRRSSAARGEVPVQVARTIPAGWFRDATAPPDAPPFAVEAGERSVLAHYLAALDGARHAIYLENQFFASRPVFAALEAALARGVEVVAVVPRAPLEEVRVARADPRSRPLYDALAALGRHDRFTLAGLVVGETPGAYRDVYVHAKAAIVDDRWLTIGSANLERQSLGHDTELNAVVWDAGVARALRRSLFAEHLGDGGDEDPAVALARFRDVARANAARLARGEPLAGLATALDPASYAA